MDRPSQQYVVIDFVKIHNHPLTPPQCVPFLRSHKKLQGPDKVQISSMRSVGIRPSKIMDYMVQQFLKDVYNYIYIERRLELREGDVEGTLAYLCTKVEDNPHFYYKYDVDKEHILYKLFWTD